MKYRGAVVRNGKGAVAVLYTPHTRTGWSTRATGKTAASMMFCPEIVDLVLSCIYDSRRETYAEIKRLAKKKWPKVSLESPMHEHYVMCCLEVAWVPKATLFKISEFDGCESVEAATTKTYWEV
jgi:hypothetical protein